MGIGIGFGPNLGLSFRHVGPPQTIHGMRCTSGSQSCVKERQRRCVVVVVCTAAGGLNGHAPVLRLLRPKYFAATRTAHMHGISASERFALSARNDRIRSVVVDSTCVECEQIPRNNLLILVV